MNKIVMNMMDRTVLNVHMGIILINITYARRYLSNVKHSYLNRGDVVNVILDMFLMNSIIVRSNRLNKLKIYIVINLFMANV